MSDATLTKNMTKLRKENKETKVWSLRKTIEEQRNEGANTATKTIAVQVEVEAGGMTGIRAYLCSLSEQISKIATQQTKLMGLFEDVQKLRKLLREKDKVI